MIDGVTQLGSFQLNAPAVAATGAGSGVLNLITSQAQGVIAFYQLASANTAAGGTLITSIQTSVDNTNWTNVANGTFGTITNVAGTAGVQAIFVDSAILNTFNRVNEVVTGTTPNFVAGVVAVYVQKNA